MPSPPSRPRLSTALKATALWHLGGAAALLAAPAAWPWVAGLVAANHAVLTTAALLPRGRLLGPNLTRLPGPARARGWVALTFDDGPDPEVTPQVLDLLDRHRARASFFCVAERACRHAELTRELARRGHGVENHTYAHPHAFGMYSPGGLRREILRAQDALTGLAGRAPRFFRAPVGIRSPFLAFTLSGLGLSYVSWTRRGLDTVSRSPDAVLRRLGRGLAAGDVLVLHDGASARTPAGRPVVLEVLPRLLGAVAAAGLTAVTLTQACDAAD